MATLAQIVVLAQNKVFSARLQAAAMTIALEVMAEAESVFANANRRSLASGVIAQPDAYEARMAIAVLTDDATYRTQAVDPAKGQPSTAADVKLDATADKDLLTRLRAVWNLLAGVMPETPTIPGGDLPPPGVG